MEHKKSQLKKSHEFSQYVAIFLTVIFTTFVTRTIEESFTRFQELSFLMDLGLYLIIFLPFHYVVSRFTGWLYSGGEEKIQTNK